MVVTITEETYLAVPAVSPLRSGCGPTRTNPSGGRRADPAAALPHPRFTKHFLKHIPEIDQVTELDGVGHIPMFEAPERIADLIITWVDAHTAPVRQADHRGA
jgi:hypothetical protein